MECDENIRLDQNLLYHKSLYTDSIKDLHTTRENLRLKISPQFSVSLEPSSEQIRLLRLLKLGPNNLLKDEYTYIQSINTYLQYINNGGCINLHPSQLEQLEKSGRLFTFM